MTEEIRWVSASTLDDLWEGDLLDVDVDGEPVMLVHLAGGLVKGYQGMCPHQELLLADGKWDPDTGILLCHGHNWEFDLASGQGINPTGCRLYEYAVRVEDSDILVGVPQDGQRHHLRHDAP